MEFYRKKFEKEGSKQSNTKPKSKTRFLSDTLTTFNDAKLR